MRRVVELTLAALLGAMVSGAGAWVTMGRSVATRDEVIGLIGTHSPYLKDQRVLNDAIEQLYMLASEQQQIREQLARIETRLEVLIEQHR